ncbi:MAG: lysophospholipase [Hydrococcus sp. Prado102]|jgi:pimeloyl-ACP methyl ester carboxylesterase|nr:lysophospholipase [Hydrococcus sp. Prado102]
MVISLESSVSPDFILFAQHGWADTNRAIAQLANKLATPNTLVISPDLGYFQTWLRIEPLVRQVERMAIETVKRYPNAPIRIIGHSMGGLIWLEVLDRQPQLRSKIESFVLVGSPIGGADLARFIDPLGIGIGIARDLGINRRAIAQRLAREIPTLIIAGDIDNGSDGTITLESTRFDGAKFVLLQGISHAALKNHFALVEIIQDFWANRAIATIAEADFATMLIERLRSIPGMTDAHRRGFSSAQTYLTFKSGITLRTWKNSLQIQHVFVGGCQEDCLWGGFVGWLHDRSLQEVLTTFKKEHFYL